MKRSWLFPIASALCILGAASALAASDDSDEDGQTLAAKPGMARVYLIEGFVADGPVSGPDFFLSEKRPQRDANGVWVVPGGPMAAGAAAGMLIAALLNSPREKATEFTHVKKYLGQGRFYLGEKKLGEIKEAQYVAADFAPGSYEIRFNDPHEGPKASLTLAEGDVVYLLADFHYEVGMLLEVCHKNCGDFVLKGHRVPTFPKPGSNIPNF